MAAPHQTSEHRYYEREALLFTAAVRALGASGYSSIGFDVGGKKARRRYVSAVSPEGDGRKIWIKSATPWHEMADAIRFPWKKISISPDGVSAVTLACEEASKRGVTHFLATAGDDPGALSFARIYRLEEVPGIVSAQAAVINSVFYRAHSASLLVRSIASEFDEAVGILLTSGEDILNPPHRESSASSTIAAARIRSGVTYRRDPKVRAKALEIASGRCECCGELGFLTEAGDRYLETHHVVGVAERGPDSLGNIVAVCPTCHRKAHYAVDRIQVEKAMLEAIRRRGFIAPLPNTSLERTRER